MELIKYTKEYTTNYMESLITSQSKNCLTDYIPMTRIDSNTEEIPEPLTSSPKPYSILNGKHNAKQNLHNNSSDIMIKPSFKVQVKRNSKALVPPNVPYKSIYHSHK